MDAKWTLRRIGLRSAVRTGALVSMVLGFVFGLIWASVIALFSSVFAAAFNASIPFGMPIALLLIPFICAAFYGALGTFISFIGALIYNLVAGIFGGLELDLGFERRDEPDQYI